MNTTVDVAAVVAGDAAAAAGDGAPVRRRPAARWPLRASTRRQRDARRQGHHVEALCPGVDRASLDITVVGDAVTIRGERKPEPDVAGGRYYRRERPLGAFTRTLGSASASTPTHPGDLHQRHPPGAARPRARGAQEDPIQTDGPALTKGGSSMATMTTNTAPTTTPTTARPQDRRTRGRHRGAARRHLRDRQGVRAPGGHARRRARRPRRRGRARRARRSAAASSRRPARPDYQEFELADYHRASRSPRTSTPTASPPRCGTACCGSRSRSRRKVQPKKIPVRTE